MSNGLGRREEGREEEATSAEGERGEEISFYRSSHFGVTRETETLQ